MKRWDWGFGTGKWGLGSREWGMGTREWGMEDGGAVGGQPIEDNRCGNQLSTIRLPLSEFAYYFFK